MALCPRCEIPLVRRRTPCGQVYACPKCGGQNVALQVMRKAGASAAFLRHLWAGCWRPNAASILRCPHCHRRALRVTMPGEPRSLNLDVCTFCRTVWFDRDEFEAMRTMSTVEKPLSPEVRERLAVMQIEMENKLLGLDRGLLTDDGPPHWWQWVPALAGMPVEEQAPDRAARPWLTWGIAAVIALIFTETWGRLPETARYFGFAPGRVGGHVPVTALTCFFVHAGIFHVVSNLYFFLIFGDNVEDNLGRMRFLLLVLASHLAGVLLHACLDPNSQVPLVGASAGISGVLGYYAVTFPRARVGVLWRLVVLLIYDRMPALAYLGLYAVVQFIGACEQVAGFGRVSYLAHLGGLAVGCLAALGAYAARRRPPAFLREV